MTAEIRHYEYVVLARPDISSTQMEALIEESLSLVNELGGQVLSNEYWGLRNLAYRINKSRKAHYALFDIAAPSSVVDELERRHKLNEDVVRLLKLKVETPGERPSPMLSRKDRDEKRRARRDSDRGRDDGRDFGDRDLDDGVEE